MSKAEANYRIYWSVAIANPPEIASIIRRHSNNKTENRIAFRNFEIKTY